MRKYLKLILKNLAYVDFAQTTKKPFYIFFITVSKLKTFGKMFPTGSELNLNYHVFLMRSKLYLATCLMTEIVTK